MDPHFEFKKEDWIGTPRVLPPDPVFTPLPSRGLRAAAVVVGVCIVALIGSVCVLAIHFLFTRFW